MNRVTELRLMEAALAHRDDLTPEEIERLEWNRDLISSPLFVALEAAARRGDDDVVLALGKEIVRRFAINLGLAKPECIIYCRVSSEQQTAGHGLTRQLDVCQDWAHQKNYSVVAVFSEVASGAASLPVRAQAERMAAKRECKIVCEDYDRWSRKGVEDLPPANVEMAADSAKMLEQELLKIMSPFQLRLVNRILQ